MKKRMKKRIAVAIDGDEYYLNCYGERIRWTKDEIKQARRKARKLAKIFRRTP
jgi:hypothetical protein